jgi:hypothetical protein
MLVFRVNINKKIRLYWDFIQIEVVENFFEDQWIAAIDNREKAIIVRHFYFWIKIKMPVYSQKL